MTTNRPTSTAARLALVALGLILSLAALELLLQLGAAYNRRALQGAVPALAGGARRIVCLGDSNTFGIGMPRDATYPAFLQRLLAGNAATAGAAVFNLGIPGTNSSVLRRRLSEVIDTFQPDVLLVMIGANDFWTVPAPIAGDAMTWRQRLWAYSRVYRLFYMLARSLERTKADVVVDAPAGRGAGGLLRYGDASIDLFSGGRPEPQSAWREGLFENLRAMTEMARSRGVDLVLLTYPAEGRAYGQANQVIRGAAAGASLIDLGSAFLLACPAGACPEIFLPDLHPAMQGYQLAATLVWRWIRERLGLATRAEARAADPPFPATVEYLRRIDAAAGAEQGGAPTRVWVPPAEPPSAVQAAP